MTEEAVQILPVPEDDQGRRLLGRWSELGTKIITGIDTTGTDISFTVDIKGIDILPSAAATFAGTISGYTDDVDITNGISFPICVPAGTIIGKLKAGTGTITARLAFGR